MEIRKLKKTYVPGIMALLRQKRDSLRHPIKNIKSGFLETSIKELKILLKSIIIFLIVD